MRNFTDFLIQRDLAKRSLRNSFGCLKEQLADIPLYAIIAYYDAYPLCIQCITMPFSIDAPV